MLHHTMPYSIAIYHITIKACLPPHALNHAIARHHVLHRRREVQRDQCNENAHGHVMHLAANLFVRRGIPAPMRQRIAEILDRGPSFGWPSVEARHTCAGEKRLDPDAECVWRVRAPRARSGCYDRPRPLRRVDASLPRLRRVRPATIRAATASIQTSSASLLSTSRRAAAPRIANPPSPR